MQFCFFNIVFLRPKPNGSWRLILDVSRLNEFLVVNKFSMDTTQVIRRSMPENSWATSVDFSDAFHHLPIHRNFRHFLAFQVGRRRFQYCACPFGLSPIPQVFTELCLPVKVFARQAWQCTVFQYIDDWLFITPSQRCTTEVTHLFICLCVRLGLTVNLDKSSLTARHSRFFTLAFSGIFVARRCVLRRRRWMTSRDAALKFLIRLLPLNLLSKRCWASWFHLNDSYLTVGFITGICSAFSSSRYDCMADPFSCFGRRSRCRTT